jgi:deoxyribodipyrimidine photo-lyase
MTRADALESWNAFLPRVQAYANARNHVEVAHHNVSRLSAAIGFRLLLEDEIIEQTLALHSLPAVEKWLQEVCWRRYWKGWLELRPSVWTHWRQRVTLLRRTLPAETLTRVEAVAAGESGVACMDAMARELTETGYLHNHARMWWASFWIHVERLPWELGADFFFRHLLDADPASNTLSWRWVAGLQTPGKTYLVRLSNIEKYAPHYLADNTAGTDRIADSVVMAVAVEETVAVQKQALPIYATSLSETKDRTGLWLHPDDLTPELGPLASIAPVSIAACISDHVYHEIYNLSSQRMVSLHTVLSDGLARASTHFGCTSVSVTVNNPVQGICDWAVEHELEEIVAFAPLVGPIHDMLPRLTQQLGLLCIRLTLVRRESDDNAFSFASAGFFPFWQKMSRHLSQSRLA